MSEEISREEIAAMLAAIHDDDEDKQLADAMQTLKDRGYITEDGEPITWITGNDGAQVAARNMPVDKMQQICAIIGGEVVGEPCEDAISRQAVLDYCIRYGKSDTWDYLNNLPSVQPIRPRGHWILVDSRVKGGYWKCSECLCHKTMGFGHTDLFCPNCGADMREETNHE